MSIFGKLFGGGAHSGDSKVFARSFLSSQVFILSLPIPSTLDPATLTQEQLLEHIRAAAKASSEQTGITPFTYTEGAQRVFPVFTNQEAAKVFIKRYVTKINRIVPFQISGLKGSVLLPHLRSGVSVVLNASGKDERRLSERDLEELAKY